MSAFIDQYMPERIVGYGFKGSPRPSTNITAVASGKERRNQNRLDPLRVYSCPDGIRCAADVFDLQEMFIALSGPLCTWPFRDPLDFASVKLAYPGIEPNTGPTDQVLGVGDGFQTEFQLRRLYEFGTRQYYRAIYHPVVSTVELALNALPADDVSLPGGPYTWSVSRETGVVTISPAPTVGMIVTAGFLYDVEVRFESDDSLDIMIEAYKVAGFAEINLVEVPPC